MGICTVCLLLVCLWRACICSVPHTALSYCEYTRGCTIYKCNAMHSATAAQRTAPTPNSEPRKPCTWTLDREPAAVPRSKNIVIQTGHVAQRSSLVEAASLCPHLDAHPARGCTRAQEGSPPTCSLHSSACSPRGIAPIWKGAWRNNTRRCRLSCLACLWAG